MLVELGNSSAHECIVEDGNHSHAALSDDGPRVTYVFIPDDYSCEAMDVNELALQLVRNPGSTHLPGQEALLCVIHQDGLWRHHSTDNPSWVWSDNPILEATLAAFYGCPAGRPDDIEETHHTNSGPPGVGV